VPTGDGEARRLVEDGTLRSWLANGQVTGEVSGFASLASELADIERWVGSTYGLFAIGPEVCSEL
jgi:hypothetical protein